MDIIKGEEPIRLQNDTESTGKLKIKVDESKDGALVSLAGPLDIDSSPTFRDRLLALVKSRRHKLVSVDLFAITRIDSSGLATLIEALKAANASKTEMRLQGLHDEIRQLFELSGILALFTGTGQSPGQSGSGVI